MFLLVFFKRHLFLNLCLMLFQCACFECIQLCICLLIYAGVELCVCVCVVSPGEFGLQPEPSLVLSQLVQRHAGPSLARQPSPPTQQVPPTSASPALQGSAPAQGAPLMAAGSAKPPAPSAGLDPQGSSMPQQQRAQLKGQKRRIPPTSKVGWDMFRVLEWCSLTLCFF